jgi:hypothetical protein
MTLKNETDISLQRAWASPQPITDPTTKDIVCNNPGSPSHMAAIVRPNGRVTAYWDKTFDHPNGPLIVWMTECGPRGSCSRMTRLAGLDWFKIAQVGLESGSVGNGKWGAASMMANNFSHTSVIPNSLPDGDYLIRHEIIALDSKPTAYYVQCAQLTVFSNGGEIAEDKWRVKIPGVYSMNDTNLNIQNLNADMRTNYSVPGPPVYPGIPSWAIVDPPNGRNGPDKETPRLNGELDQNVDPPPPPPLSKPPSQAAGTLGTGQVASETGSPKPSGLPKPFPKGFGPRSGGQQAPPNPKDVRKIAHPNGRRITEDVVGAINHPAAL